MADDSQEVADIIDGLGDAPAPIDVYHATREYDTRYLASAGAAAAAAAGGGGSSPVKTATHLLTSAEILALDSVAVTLVEGVAGSMFIPVMVSYSTEGGTPYINGGNNRLWVGDLASFFIGLQGFGTLISDPDNTAAAFDVPAGVGAGNALVGGDIQIAAGDPNTDGDFDVTVTVLYQEVSVP